MFTAQSKNFKKTASQLIVSSVMISCYMANQAFAAEEAKAIKRLPSIVVTETRDNKSYNTTSSSIGKITSPLKDTPKTITSIPKSLMDDQAATSMKDALRNAPGISINSGEGGNQGDSVNIRGFSSRNDFFIDGMRDFGSYNRDPFNVEGIEVLQGPSSVLFGRGSVGGVINQESKDAELISYNKSSIALGTNDTIRLTTDVNESMSDTSAFRINLMTHSNKVEDRDTVEDNRYGIAPSLSFGLGTDTRFTLNYLHQTEDNIPDYGIGFMKGRPARVDRSNYYGFEDSFFQSKVNITTAKFEHDFDENTSISNKLRYADYKRKLNTTNPTHNAAGTITTYGNINRDSREVMLANQTDLTKKFEALGFEHESVSGIELSRETSTPEGYNFTTVPPNTSTVSPASQPFNYSAKTLSQKNRGSIDTISAYVSDTVHLDPKWDVLGSVRLDHLRTKFKSVTTLNSSGAVVPGVAFNKTDDLVSWTAGVVYKPTENGSIYASTGTSFQPSAETTFSLSSATVNVDPESSQTYEVGTKWDFFKKKLSTSLAIFRTDKDNVRETDPASPAFQVLAGRQVVNGFTAQMSGYLTNKWQVYTGYTYMDSEVKKSVVVASPKGKRLGGAPAHTFNLFTTYKLPFGFEIGGGLNGVSSRNGSTTGVTSAPGYVIYNAMAKYELNKKVDFQFNVENLTNKNYTDQISGRVVPGEGQVFMLTTNFSF